jgi:hypothetical protein
MNIAPTMRRCLILRTGVEKGGLWGDAGERAPRRLLGVASVGREATTNGRPYVISFLMRIAVLIAAFIQSLAKSSERAITPLPLGVRKISTLVNGPVRGYGDSRTSLGVC